MKAMPKLNTDPTSIISFGIKLIRKVELVMSRGDEGLTFLDYIIADGLLSFFWVLFKKYVFEIKDHMFDVEYLKELLSMVINLMDLTVNESK